MDSGALESVRRVLRLRLLAMVSVQSCFLSREDETLLLTHTWMNVLFHVRILTTPIKTGAIKKFLKDSTDSGIGTVFLIDRALMPEHDTRISVPEWLHALHALTQDRVYTVRLDGEQVRLGQLHFEPIGATGEHVAKYGPLVNLDRMRYFRANIKHQVMKGDWLVVDFGGESFWRDPHRPSVHQPQYHRPNPSEYSEKAWKSWSGTTWDSPPLQDSYDPRQPSRQDVLSGAYACLKIPRDATHDEVRAAYHKMALAYHPDTSSLPKDEAEQLFRELNAAYEVIQKARNWA